MRTSLVPSMLNMLAYNLNRGNDNVRLFEVGNIFEASGPKALEMKRISIGATGSMDADVVADWLRGRRRVRSRFSI